MEISQIIKEQRKNHLLSQEDLAKKLNISRQSISKWETGQALPNTEQLIKISDIFDVSLDELIRGDKKVEKKVIKDSKTSFLWWEDKKARPVLLIIWCGVIPLLFILKFALHLF